jgi:hypothetical protein
MQPLYCTSCTCTSKVKLDKLIQVRRDETDSLPAIGIALVGGMLPIVNNLIKAGRASFAEDMSAMAVVDLRTVAGAQAAVTCLLSAAARTRAACSLPSDLTASLYRSFNFQAF